MAKRTFYTYMLTNLDKTVLYIGFTNDLAIRLVEHWLELKDAAFTKRYHTHYLVWFEETRYVLNAMALEKELKNLLREKKEAIITEFNPNWKFFNEEVLGNWPPTPEQISQALERQLKSRFR